MKQKGKKASSTYVGTEEPAGAVIWGFSVNKAF